jgi:hypothetical protein
MIRRMMDVQVRVGQKMLVVRTRRFRDYTQASYLS